MAKEIYSVDIKLCATAYIVAESETEAQEIANKLTDDGIEFGQRYQLLGDNICMDGRSYERLLDNDEQVALSPAMTLYGPWDGQKVDLVEVIEDEEDEEQANAAG